MNKRKIYLASRYSRREELRQYAASLMFRGETITSRWLFEQHKMPEGLDDNEQNAFSSKLAQDDFDDVKNANTIIQFTELPRTATRGGRHVELGIALSMMNGNSSLKMNEIILVGPKENVFHWLPCIRYYHTVKEWADDWSIDTPIPEER